MYDEFGNYIGPELDDEDSDGVEGDEQDDVRASHSRLHLDPRRHHILLPALPPPNRPMSDVMIFSDLFFSVLCPQLRMLAMVVWRGDVIARNALSRLHAHVGA